MPPETSTPARGRRLAPEARRAQILEHATRTLATHGPTGFTLEAVAEEAGVTGPLLRHYFGSRDGLLITVATSAIDQVMDIFFAPPESRGLAERLAGYLDFTEQNPWGHAVWTHVGGVHPDLEVLVRDGRRRLAERSFGRAWSQMTAEEQYLAIGWVGYVESAVAEWIVRGCGDREPILRALLHSAAQLSVSGI